MEKICEQCQAVFIINEKLKRYREKRFCCSTCSKRYTGLKNKGRKHSDEVNKSKGLVGYLNPFFGKKHSKDLQNQITQTKFLTNLKNVKYCSLSELEHEILDGIMISDGCLTSTRRISARLTLGFKYSETLDNIKESLPSIIFSKTYMCKNGREFHNKSKMYRDLLDENKRWYVNKIKIVPKDIRITKNSCYWWFIGDGYNSNNNVYLCTDSYTKNENLWLINKFNNLGFKCNITSKNRIRFFKEDSQRFLNWIKPINGVHKQYEYKWKTKQQ